MASAIAGNLDHEQPVVTHTRKSRSAKEVAEVVSAIGDIEVIPEPAPVVAPIPAPVVAPVAEVVQAVLEISTTVDAVKAYTLVDVRAKLIELSTAGHKDEIKALFAKFGAKKLTEVPEENYTELMTAAKEIG
jgi:hypothetical protein